jgi:hypothetical protein
MVKFHLPNSKQNPLFQPWTLGYKLIDTTTAWACLHIHAMLVLHLNTELPIIANTTDIFCTHVMASEKLKIRSFYERQPLLGGGGKERSFLPFEN